MSEDLIRECRKFLFDVNNIDSIYYVLNTDNEIIQIMKEHYSDMFEIIKNKGKSF